MIDFNSFFVLLTQAHVFILLGSKKVSRKFFLKAVLFSSSSPFF
jgi:hypothetical protein